MTSAVLLFECKKPYAKSLPSKLPIKVCASCKPMAFSVSQKGFGALGVWLVAVLLGAVCGLLKAFAAVKLGGLLLATGLWLATSGLLAAGKACPALKGALPQ
jgi:hypothetical protein